MFINVEHKMFPHEEFMVMVCRWISFGTKQFKIKNLDLAKWLLVHSLE